MWDLTELRKHAKEITKDCEKKGYTVEQTSMLVAVLKDEISKCNEACKKNSFIALE